MQDGDVAFSDEFDQALKERGQIWNALDKVRDQNNKITALGSKIKAVGSPEPLADLTETKAPPEEIHATLWALDTELKRIEQDEGAIQANETRIAQIKKEIQNRWIMFFVAVGVIALIFLYILGQVF